MNKDEYEILFNASMTEDNTLDAEMNLDDLVFDSDVGEFVETINATKIFHKLLLGRDESNQHPIEAVSHLDSELDARPKEALTNLELEKLLK